MQQTGRNAPLVALVFGIAILFSLGMFFYELKAVRSATEATFRYRSKVIDYYINARIQDVDAMARAFVQHYAYAPERGFGRLRREPKFGGWALSGFESEGGVAGLAGSASGLGDLPSGSVRRELAAALTLDAQIRSVLEFNDEVSWIYYTSAQRFVYIAPKIPVADFHFTDGLYEKPFWWMATPAFNPQSKQIISNLYEDAAGKGLMITISSPIVIERKFVGVVSLDLGIQLLQRLITTGRAPGETILISNDGQVVARAGNFSMYERYRIPLVMQDWSRQEDGRLWLSSEAGRKQLRVLHRVSPIEIYREAALQSLPVWILLLLLVLMFLLLRRLRSALNLVTHLMYQDPLTQSMNRRGLFERADRLRALAERNGSKLAVAIFDIDFFKQINDSCGHEAGDQVLRAIGGGLKAQLREYDVLCRWGGEEFVALFLVDSPEAAPGVAERLRASVSNREVGATLSGGVVIWRDAEALPTAISRADRLMYEAKHEGRNRLKADCGLLASGQVDL